MHDKNLHINKKLKDNYPLPDVPENDAWATMNKMLDDDIQTPLPPPNASNGINKFWGYGLAALFVVCMLLWIDKNRQQQTLTAKHIENADEKNKKDIHQFSVNDSSTLFNKKSNVEPSVANQNNNKKDTAENNLNATDASLATEHKIKTSLKEENTNSITSLTPNDDRTKNKNSSKGSIGNNAGQNNSDDIKSDNLKKDKILSFTIKKNGTSLPNYVKDKNQINNFQQKNDRQQDFDNSETFSNKKNKNEYLKSSEKINRSRIAKKDKANRHNNKDISVARNNAEDEQSKADDNTIAKTKNAVDKNKTEIKDVRENSITKMKPVKQGPIQNDFLLPVTTNDFTKVNAPLKSSFAKAQKDKSEKKFINFDFGLQWNIPVPVQGTSDYFTGTDDKSKPYNLLIPEIWISKTFGKNNNHKIQLQANLNQQYFAGKKQVTSSSGPLSPLDSATIVTRSTKLLKICGVGVALQYNYNFNAKWSAGVGVNYSLNGKALFNKQTTLQSNGKILSDSTYGVTKSSANWQYINKGLLAGKLEASYSFKKFQVGAAVFIPVNNISAFSNNSIRPLNGQLFLRWKIK